jgi:transaldolase
LFKKLIKDLVIQDITINPSLEKEMKTDKYVDNDFLLNKTKNFKTSSPYRQLRKMQRWFKKEQKDKLPRVKRIRPRVTIFERDHN